MQKTCNSIAKALASHLFCLKPSKYYQCWDPKKVISVKQYFLLQYGREQPGRAMGCHLWFRSMICIVCFSLCCSIQYHVILNHVIIGSHTYTVMDIWIFTAACIGFFCLKCFRQYILYAVTLHFRLWIVNLRPWLCAREISTLTMTLKSCRTKWWVAVNSLWSNDALWYDIREPGHHWFRQQIATCLSPLPVPVLTCYQLDP